MWPTLLFLVSGVLWADPHPEVVFNSPGQLIAPPSQVENKLWLWVPQVSVVSPQKFRLSNESHQLEYSPKLSGLPAFYVGFSRELGEWGDFRFSGFSKMGISAKEVSSAEIAETSEVGTLSLLWVPTAIGTEIRYNLNWLPSVKPTLAIGLGVDYFYQSGTLPNVNSSFFIPTYFVMPGLSFFSEEGSSDWFRGFTFGISFHDSFASPQTIRTWSFDLGLKVNI